MVSAQKALSAACLAAFSAFALIAGPAAALDLTVELDHAHPVRLSEPASAVIVGNPVIADVTPHDGQTLLVTGKSFGATNVIALDADGNQIYAAEIHVVDAAGGRLTVQRGLSRESYVCHGECSRVPVPGDGTEIYDQTLDARMKAIEAASGQAQSSR
ncbi:MAG: pilus assembly protein N-terminal domain-containing protein [Maricaulaceae bacterium]|jgi:hypothetical protein